MSRYEEGLGIEIFRQAERTLVLRQFNLSQFQSKAARNRRQEQTGLTRNLITEHVSHLANQHDPTQLLYEHMTKFRQARGRSSLPRVSGQS